MFIATSNFLVPNGTLVVDLIAFVLLFYVLGRKVLPGINKKIEERQELIRSSLDDAEKAKDEAEETRSQRQGILDEARQQAREIVATANRTGEQVRTDTVSRGQQEYERLVASAESEIKLARNRAVDEVSTQVGVIVLAVARQVIGREIDPSGHQSLIDEAVLALRAEASAGQSA